MNKHLPTYKCSNKLVIRNKSDWGRTSAESVAYSSDVVLLNNDVVPPNNEIVVESDNIVLSSFYFVVPGECIVEIDNGIVLVLLRYRTSEGRFFTSSVQYRYK